MPQLTSYRRMHRQKTCSRPSCRGCGHRPARPKCMCRLLFATEFLRGFGNRSYVSGLLIGSRAVALMGLRTRLGLISGKVDDDLKGRQTLGRIFSVPCCLLRRELRFGIGRLRSAAGSGRNCQRAISSGIPAVPRLSLQGDRFWPEAGEFRHARCRKSGSGTPVRPIPCSQSGSGP
jgi:hypothetical protein